MRLHPDPHDDAPADVVGAVTEALEAFGMADVTVWLGCPDGVLLGTERGHAHPERSIVCLQPIRRYRGHDTFGLMAHEAAHLVAGTDAGHGGAWSNTDSQFLSRRPARSHYSELRPGG